MGDEEPGQLFENVVFTIIPDEDLNAHLAHELTDHLERYGGVCRPLRYEDKQIDALDEITHIISVHIDFPQYAAALEHGISVVKPSWVIQSLVKGRVSQPRQHSSDPSQYFNEVIMTTAGLPECDKDALIAGVIALGGQYSSALSRLVTHIVTLDPTNDEKCQIAEEKRLAVKMVLPHWFDDCFKLGKKISEAPYMFPNPEILRTEHSAKIRDLPSPYLEGATAAVPTGVPPSTPADSPSRARRNLNAFMSRTVFLSEDLHLSYHLRAILDELINQGGGTLSDNIDEADIYIGHYREGEAYTKASRSGKEVANLSWLYHVINKNRYTSPLSKLLHYPVPRNGIPGFESFKISVSNYQGDARVYIENLIRHSGAEFTRTMKEGNNTHLITAHLNSAKVEAAQEWGLHIINHLWLEESYSKCAVQTLTNPRYLTFPARTNLGEVTGQTRLDMKRVERTHFPPLRQSPKKKSVQTPAENRTPVQPIVPNRLEYRIPEAAAADPMSDPDGNDEEAQAEPELASKAKARPPRSRRTPERRDDEKENQSPILATGGRASKTKAMGLLHKQADDIALYNREIKRKGGVTHGGRRSANQDDFSSPAARNEPPRKRKSDEATYQASGEGSDLSDGETLLENPAKKAKHAPEATAVPPIKYRMMVSGDERWLGKPGKESQDRIKLRQLGIQLVKDPDKVDILVAPKILRTRKFVAALAGAPLVVDSSYLDTALKQGKLVEKPKILDDRETEERLGFRLTDALERAQSNQRKLLRGWTIFVTKQIQGGFDTFKEIITLNGGTALLYQGRTGMTMPKRRLKDDPEAGSESQNQGGEEEFDYVYLVSGQSEAEGKLWKTFSEQARKQDLQARVVQADWLLHTAMSQHIIWNDKWAIDESMMSS